MSNYRNLMRRMRKFTADVEKNYKSRDAELAKLADFKGSPHYDREVMKVDSKIENERVRLVKEVQKDLTGVIGEMRQNVGNRIIKAPTADMVNSLAILGMLDSVTPTDIKLYAEQMADCPLAMKRLQQIGKAHNIQIMVPDTEAMMRAVDVLEGNVAAYIQGFTGSQNITSFTVKQLHDLYFQPEEYYMKTPMKSCANADDTFWQSIVGIGSPAMLDNADEGTSSADVKYFFATLDGLMEFMGKQTEGLEGKAYTDKINEILADCPGQYGAAYRYFKASGEKVPLNVEVEDKN